MKGLKRKYEMGACVKMRPGAPADTRDPARAYFHIDFAPSLHLRLVEISLTLPPFESVFIGSMGSMLVRVGFPVLS